MANNTSSRGAGMGFAIGALTIVVAVLAFVVFFNDDSDGLTITIGDNDSALENAAEDVKNAAESVANGG